MSDTESKEDFQLFRETLTELERLLDFRRILHPRWTTLRITIKECVIHEIKLLSEFDVNTSESHALEELELLAKLRTEFQRQIDLYEYDDGDMFNEIIKSEIILNEIIKTKIDFIKEGSFSEPVSRDGIKPISALERLVKLQFSLTSGHMNDLLDLKIREFAFRSRAKAS